MDLTDRRAASTVSALNEIDRQLADDFIMRWEAHAAATRPLLVVFGEHNTGKSALIARLLIDAGHALPPDLTIGARAESTSGEPIEWDGWRILDLPGIVSDRRVHDIKAWDGVELADAILLVMQPKLLTGEGLEILQLVDGSWFTPGAEPLAWDGELVFAVAQADTGPGDLELFPEAAQGYADQLESSLNAILGGVGGLRDAPLYVTAPSPNALLDHVENPTPASFDAYREWDGMADLANALMGLGATKDRLRPTAMRRFLLRHVRVALEHAGEDRAQLANARDQAELAAKTHEMINSEIDSVAATTQIKLTAVLTECFVAVYERAPSARQAPALLHQEFAKRAEAFERTFVVDAERLIEETRRVVADLPTVQLSRPFSSGTPITSKPSRERLTAEDATSSAKAVARSGVEARLGESVETVKAKLASLDKRAGEDLQAKLREAGFKSLNEKEAAGRMIRRLEQVERGLDALPHLEALGSALWEKYREKQSQKRSEALAEREAEYVSALSTELMDAEETGFRTRLESIRAVIHDSLGAAGSLASDLGTALNDLDARSARLRDAAREYAVPSPATS